MSSRPEGQKEKNKGGRLIPALCNILGTLILLSVILSCLPPAMARIRGDQIYNVVSGSMEPGIPVGSAIYVQAVEPEAVEEGDVIAFCSGTSVIAHRVVRNQTVEGEFTTKGDANEQEDMNPVRYGELIGRVSCHYPVLGLLLEAYTSTLGKVYLICFAACGAMLNMLAGRLRNR